MLAYLHKLVDLFGDYGNLDLGTYLRLSDTASLKGIDVSIW